MQRKTNSQVIIAYEYIRDQIISYLLPPETAISDNKFAKELNMSRAPIREAILLLQMDGLVQINVDGKVIVSPIGTRDIVDILHIRCALESEAIILIASAGWLSKEQEDTLTEIHAQMSSSIQNDFISDNYKYDDLFHSTLVSYSGNQRICEILERMRLQMQRARWLNIAHPERRVEATNEHSVLLHDILNHDETHALVSLRAHFQNSAQAFCAVLEDKHIQALAAMISNFCNHH